MTSAESHGVDVQFWGDEGIDRVLDHCREAYGELGPVHAQRREGNHCLTPTYRLLFQHVLSDEDARLDTGHQALLRFLQEDPQVPSMRLLLRRGRGVAIHDF